MLFIFFLELFFLFILSRFLTRELSIFFHRVSRSRFISTYLIALIFLPGTLIHELSHAIVAKLLFVNVGKMELMPEMSDDSLKLGSVEVGKTDFIRNFFIGVAPFFVGTSILLVSMWYVFDNKLIGLNLITGLFLYLIFVISNSMYSSKKDMEGAIEFFVFILIILGGLFLVGVRMASFGFLGELISPSVVKLGVYFLLIPIGIDLFIIIVAKLLNKRV